MVILKEIPKIDPPNINPVYRSLDFSPCFLGVNLTSVGTGLFAKRSILWYAKLLAKHHCPSFVVVIADSLERLNIQYFKGLPPAASEKKAREIGIQIKSCYDQLKKIFPFMHVTSTTEISRNDKFQIRLNSIKSEFTCNPFFRKEVEEQVRLNLRRKISPGRIPLILSKYLLEELAICSMLYDGTFQDSPIQISPHSDPLMDSVFLGKFPNLNSAIKIKPNRYRYLVLPPFKEKIA